jgi:hypothetical protein
MVIFFLTLSMHSTRWTIAERGMRLHSMAVWLSHIDCMFRSSVFHTQFTYYPIMSQSFSLPMPLQFTGDFKTVPLHYAVRQCIQYVSRERVECRMNITEQSICYSYTFLNDEHFPRHTIMIHHASCYMMLTHKRFTLSYSSCGNFFRCWK